MKQIEQEIKRESYKSIPVIEPRPVLKLPEKPIPIPEDPIWMKRHKQGLPMLPEHLDPLYEWLHEVNYQKLEKDLNAPTISTL